MPAVVFQDIFSEELWGSQSSVLCGNEASAKGALVGEALTQHKAPPSECKSTLTR